MSVTLSTPSTSITKKTIYTQRYTRCFSARKCWSFFHNYWQLGLKRVLFAIWTWIKSLFMTKIKEYTIFHKITHKSLMKNSIKGVNIIRVVWSHHHGCLDLILKITLVSLLTLVTLMTLFCKKSLRLFCSCMMASWSPWGLRSFTSSSLPLTC